MKEKYDHILGNIKDHRDNISQFGFSEKHRNEDRLKYQAYAEKIMPNEDDSQVRVGEH